MRRTQIITIVSIAGVVVAAALALGANVGLLHAATDTKVGDLAAAGDLTTPRAGLPVDLTSAAAADTAVAGARSFAVDQAGTVTVTEGPDGLRLDSVAPNPGWRWTLDGADPSRLRITFTDGAATVRFTAELGADGTVRSSAERSDGATATHDDHSDDDHELYEGHDDDD